MRKLFSALLIVIVLISIAFLGFWNNLYSRFDDIPDNNSQNSSLLVRSIAGVYDVYFDGKKIGEVNEGEEKEFYKLNSGNRSVKLVRKTDATEFFFVLERTLFFRPASKVVIEWEAGPSLESSEGVIRYFTDVYSPDGAIVAVQPFPSIANVTFDGRSEADNVFEVRDVANHIIKVSNGDGFKIQNNITLTLEDPSNEDSVLKNVKLVIEVYLYKYPFI